MSAPSGIWDKLNRLVLFLLVLAAMIGVVIWYRPVIQTNERMRREILRLQQEIRVEEEKARWFKATIDALQHDPKTVERLARENLGYARSNEMVIRFEAPATNHVPPRP